MSLLQHILAHFGRALPALAGGVRALCMMIWCVLICAQAAMAGTISNTAQLQYTGLPSALNASVNVSTTNSTTLTSSFNPVSVNVGGSTTATITLTNTGVTPLTGAIITITPPVGTTMTITPVAGQYNVVVLGNGDIQVTVLGSLAATAALQIPASVAVSPTATPGNVPMTAIMTATGYPTQTTTSTLNILNSHVLGTISLQQVDPNGNYTPAKVFHAGSAIGVKVTDADLNVNTNVVETHTITLISSGGDKETIQVTETGVNTGVFVGNIISSALTATPTLGDGVFTVAPGDTITAQYTDTTLPAGLGTQKVLTSAGVLVDPFGVVFDASTGAPVSGASITLWDVNANKPAIVLGDNGVGTNIFPSTIISGGSFTDGSGKVYNFPAGEYRFPFIQPGTYQLKVTPPNGYSFPSTAATFPVSTVTGAPFTVVTGSKGQTFIVNPGPALHIDIPLDPKASNMFLTKTAGKQTAAIGDAVPYTISIENTSATNAVTAASITDTLPQGLRYQQGTAQLDGVSIADPAISANGRTLTFNLGNIAANSKHSLTYITLVGANAPLGTASNSAIAHGTQLATAITSNRVSADVLIKDDLMASKGFIAGRVFVDENMNGLQDKGEPGIRDARIFLEDGSFTYTDKDGGYHFEGIAPGTHVVQLDQDSLHEQYQPLKLKNTRFAGSHISQFVDTKGGSIWRSNFRVIRKPAPSAEIHVRQHIQRDGDLFDVDIEVHRQKGIKLEKLSVNYILPDGWSYQAGSGSINQQAAEPTVDITGLSWPLDTDMQEQTVHFHVQRGGHTNDKQSIAYVRFVSAGSTHGRTEMAITNIQDAVTETHEEQNFTLHLGFATRQATLTAHMRSELDKLVEKLKPLHLSSFTATGYTDNIDIAPSHRHEFANNKALSKARAQSVAHYLAKQLKLDSQHVHVLGMGADNPIASNATARGRAENRRVVINIAAEKIVQQSHVTLLDTDSQAEGKAIGSWEEHSPLHQTDSNTPQVPQEGIISPVDHANIAHPIASVRVVLNSQLKAALKLDGKVISNERIGFISKNAKTSKTSYTYIGVNFGQQGQHTLQLQGLDPFGNVRFEQSIEITRTGQIADIQVLKQADNIADGKQPVRVQLQLMDERGEVIHGHAELEWRGGDLQSLSHQQLRKLNPAQGVKDEPVSVDADGWVSLAPTTISGSHHVVLGYNDIQKDVQIFVKPAQRDWIMVGFGEGTVGYNRISGAMQKITHPSEKDRYYQDGRIAFYGKGRIKGDFLLTMAYDSAKTQGSTNNQLQQTIDPNRFYTIYGDASQQQYDASSQRKLYLKIEKNTFYALFGDFNTGLSVTELSRYSRSLNGLKSEYRGETLGYNAFITQTKQTLQKDELRGNGSSGLYHLGQKNITINSEHISVETRDRFHSEVILESRQLTRYLDYNIDYTAGTLYFKQPILSKDSALNPIYIRAEYETNSNQQALTTFGGRGSIKLDNGITLGATYIQQGKVAKDDQLAGLDASIDLGHNIKLVTELAQTRKQGTTRSNAYKVELHHNSSNLQASAYIRQVDNNFGLGQITGSENATRKWGGKASTKLGQHTTLQAEVFRQELLSTKAKRDSGSIQASHSFGSVNIHEGINSSRDTDGAGNKTTSNQLITGASAKMTERLTLHANRAQNLGKGNSVDYPTTTDIGADYLITPSTTLSVTQEWTQGQMQNTNTTRLGVRTQPWSGAQLSTSYEQQLGESGVNSFANIGLQQQWQATDTLSFSVGLDRTKTLKHPGATSLNLNVPLASGNNDDFTAISLGFSYKPEGWIWNNRGEYRTASNHRSWGINSSIQGDLTEALTSNIVLRILHDHSSANTSNTTSTLSLGTAYRPDMDGLILLNKFDVLYNKQQAATANTVNWHYINNMTANWQYRADLQWAFNYGAKWTRDTVNNLAITGYTDLLGAQATWDILEDWDISMQASMLHTWATGQSTPSLGIGIGHNLFDNLWITLGYNFAGFYDADFAAAEFTRRGVFMRFRFKFDQNNITGLLNHIQ